MKKFVDFANKLLDSDELAEDAIRNAVERAALKELLIEEAEFAKAGITMAAYDIEDIDSEDN